MIPDPVSARRFVSPDLQICITDKSPPAYDPHRP